MPRRLTMSRRITLSRAGARWLQGFLVKRHQELVRWRHEELVHRRHGLISSGMLATPAAAGVASMPVFCTRPDRRFSFSR